MWRNCERGSIFQVGSGFFLFLSWYANYFVLFYFDYVLTILHYPIHTLEDNDAIEETNELLSTYDLLNGTITLIMKRSKQTRAIRVEKETNHKYYRDNYLPSFRSKSTFTDNHTIKLRFHYLKENKCKRYSQVSTSQGSLKLKAKPSVYHTN